MGSSHQVDISRAGDVDWLRKRVEDGSFDSEAEAVAAGIAVLREREREFERWVETVGVERYDRMEAGPGRAISAEAVLRGIEERGRLNKKIA